MTGASSAGEIRAHAVPEVPGVLSAEQVRETARSIVAMQEPSGAIPWTPGDKTDVWNHVEAAMALLAAGEVEAAERAYAWTLDLQRPDGSWPMKIVEGVVEDESAETNMSAYLAVGVWHHWLVRRDLDFVQRHWPAVSRALDWVVGMQLPFGGIAWSQEWVDGRPGTVNAEALVAGSSSIHHALAAGCVLADMVGDPRPEWEFAGARLAHALRFHRDLFLDKSQFSMDWYYPVLGGAVRGEMATQLFNSDAWDTFVEDGLGIRCVSENPWVTGAETCELVMSLEANGDAERARTLFADMQHLRHENGSYWTGYVFPDEVNWPGEQTTYTAAAVILAADQLSRATPGSDVMRGEGLPKFGDLSCGCDASLDAGQASGRS